MQAAAPSSLPAAGWPVRSEMSDVMRRAAKMASGPMLWRLRRMFPASIAADALLSAESLSQCEQCHQSLWIKSGVIDPGSCCQSHNVLNAQ